MKRRALTVVVATCMILIGLMPVAALAGEGKDVYYLSLGDSLARGVQPPYRTSTAFNQGYADQLFRMVRSDISRLRLVKMGCPGETTETFIDGGLCPFQEGNQLADAVSFLESHEGQAAFVTINIGGNDVIEACLDFDTGVLDESCVDAVLPSIQERLTTILEALQDAAPGVPIYGMSYYDPFLGFWVASPAGPGDPALAQADEASMEAFNAGLVSTYHANGVSVADVAGAFAISDFGHPTELKGFGTVPRNVANVCNWTFNCTAPPHGDIHPNSDGYGVIANAFADVLEI